MGTAGAGVVEQARVLEELGVRPGERRPAWVDPFKWFARIGYEPYEEQAAFHRSGARFKVLIAGKRTGKSYAAAREVEPLILTPETHGWIVGTQYDRAEKEFGYIWDDLFRRAGFSAQERHYNVRGGYMYIRTAWNSVVHVRSAKDELSLEAEALDWVLVAEPAQHRLSTIELLMERTMEKRGVMIFPGTPSTDVHWLKEYFDLGQDPAEEDWFSIRMDAEETPYPGRDEVLRMKRYLSPLRYRRDIKAEFVATAEVVYPTFSRGTHVEEFSYRPDLDLYAAFDFGFTDPWVCLFIQEDPATNRVYVLDEYHHTRRTDADNVAAVIKLMERRGYGKPGELAGCYPDPRGANARAELAKAGFACSIRGITRQPPAAEGGKKSVIKWGCGLVRDALELREDDRPGLTVHPRCELTLDEFPNYHNVKGTDDPADEDNHAMDPLRYYYLSRHRPGREPRVSSWGGTASQQRTRDELDQAAELPPADRVALRLSREDSD